MESRISDPLLANDRKKTVNDAPVLQVEERVCASGCGFSDEKSRAADAITRSVAAKKLGLATLLCLIFIAVEIAGGLISNSLAILTDAAHLLSDVAGFAISLFAIWASSWEATPRQSYGFFRLEILGALLSIQLIWLLTGIIVYEAIYRLVHTSELVDGRLMFIVATFGLVVNIVMVVLLGHHGHGHSHDHDHDHDHGHDHGQHSRPHKHQKQNDSHDHHHDHNHNHDSDVIHQIKTQQDGDHQHDHHGHTHDHSHSENHHNNDHDIIDEIQSDETRYIDKELGRKDSFTVDIDINSGMTDKTGKKNAGNINVRGAWLHVFGDLIQSIGVMIGGAIIWARPEWRIVDLICTLLFSALVLGTTIKMLRDILEILMESTPREIDVKKLEKGLTDIDGVVAVHELHIWAITMGKTLLACHVTIYSDADADAILQKVLGYCERVFNISHVTVQIERQRGNPACNGEV